LPIADLIFQLATWKSAIRNLAKAPQARS